MKRIMILALLLVTSLAWGAVERQNITVDETFKADGVTFFMCNIKSETPDTALPLVKNCTFDRCNLVDVSVDGTNTLTKSNLIDTTEEPELAPEEKKDARISQLEKFITDNHLVTPKEISQ